MESLAPALVDGMDLFVDLLPEGSLILVCDPDRVRSRAHDLVATSAEFLEAGWAAASTGGKAPIDVDAASFHSYGDVRAAALAHGLAWWSTSPFAGDSETLAAPSRYGLRTEAGELVSIDLDTSIGAVASIATELREVSGYRGDLTRALTDIRARISAGGRVVLAAPGHGSAERLAEVLRGEELPVRVVSELPEPAAPGLVTVVQAGLTGGFTLGLDLLVLSEHDLFGQRGGGTREAHKMPSRRRTTIEPLELRAGDYVVHEQHGVGRFVEMTERVVGSGTARTTREYLVLEYAASKRGQPADRLYVPTDQLDQVSRYVGGDAPTLDRIGGSDWARRKGRARKAVREIAAELIKLYAARQATPGYAFGPDTVWQTELEEAFPYIETPDQLAAVERGQGRHAPADPDGPAHLRRRGLRQDRGRGPGRVQGGAGRQAGRDPGAHDPAGPTARPDVRRADGAVPVQRRELSPVLQRRPSPRRSSTGSPTAPSTSSSARTGCSARTSSSRTWVW